MEWILLVVGVAVGAALGWWWGRRELGPQLDQAAEEVGSLTDERKRLERELRHAVERADQTDQRLAAAELAKSESEGAGEAAMAELKATKHDLAEAERSAKSLGHQLEKAEATRQELAERVTAAEHAAADAHARFDQVTEDYVALKRQARRAEEERDAVHTDRDGTVARLEAATAQAQQEAAELRADHDRLEKALSVASAIAGPGRFCRGSRRSPGGTPCLANRSGGRDPADRRASIRARPNEVQAGRSGA